MKYEVEFIKYLETEKESSKTTISAYLADLKEYERFLLDTKHVDLLQAKSSDVTAYLGKLKQEGRSASTVNRRMVSLRTYFEYVREKGELTSNPLHGVKAPKIARRELEYFSVEDVEKLLEQPDNSPRGKRDKALLELMYACGLMAGEAADANASDLDLRIGFISCKGDYAKSRIIPIGRPARAALLDYLANARKTLLGDKEDSGALFLNYTGERITRQGIWKLFKYYGEKAGLGDNVSPQLLRNSFAAHMIMNGADLKSLQELMGHEDITATKLFLSLTKNRVMDVYDRTHPRA